MCTLCFYKLRELQACIAVRALFNGNFQNAHLRQTVGARTRRLHRLFAWGCAALFFFFFYRGGMGQLTRFTSDSPAAATARLLVAQPAHAENGRNVTAACVLRRVEVFGRYQVI